MTLIASWHGKASPVLMSDSLVTTPASHNESDSINDNQITLPSTGRLPQVTTYNVLHLADAELYQKTIIIADTLVVTFSWGIGGVVIIKKIIESLKENLANFQKTEDVIACINEIMKNKVIDVSILGLFKTEKYIDTFQLGLPKAAQDIRDDLSQFISSGTGSEAVERLLRSNFTGNITSNSRPVDQDIDIANFLLISGIFLGQEAATLETASNLFGGIFEMVGYVKKERKFHKFSGASYVLWNVAKLDSKNYAITPKRILRPHYLDNETQCVFSADLEISDEDDTKINILPTDSILSYSLLLGDNEIQKRKKSDLIKASNILVNNEETFNASTQVQVFVFSDKETQKLTNQYYVRIDGMANRILEFLNPQRAFLFKNASLNELKTNLSLGLR